MNVTNRKGVRITYGGGSTADSVGEGLYPIAPGINPLMSVVFDDTELITSLVSTNDFCKQGLAVIHTDDGVTMLNKSDLYIDQSKVKLHHPKEIDEPLWRLPRTPGAGIYGMKASDMYPRRADDRVGLNVIHSDLDAEFVQMIHATMGSPTVSTFKGAVAKGWLGNLPRLTAKMITKNPPYSMTTSLGHLDKKRMHQNSTSKKDMPMNNIVAMATSSIASENTSDTENSVRSEQDTYYEAGDSGFKSERGVGDKAIHPTVYLKVVEEDIPEWEDIEDPAFVALERD